MKKVLFIDRDGTLIVEPDNDFQVDTLEKLEFIPGVFRWLSSIATELDFELVMVTNQDGLGTESFSEESFLIPHNKMLKALENEEIVFNDILIDKSLPEDKLPTRKPGTAMLGKYLYGNYNLASSFVIGDRSTDVDLANNLGARSIFLGDDPDITADLKAENWKKIYHYLKKRPRIAEVKRLTSETDISITLNLDGSGTSAISTGIGFFDHMLEQISRHANIDLDISINGDLEIDEHHSIEDLAICLGEALAQALGSKKGINRYGFLLPMDDSLAQVAIDFGGRPWLIWEVEFKRDMIGDMPVEMFFHFFKSLSDSAKINLNIKSEGQNEHHKIEGIFKAFGKALKMAVDHSSQNTIPSTKGII